MSAAKDQMERAAGQGPWIFPEKVEGAEGGKASDLQIAAVARCKI